MQRCKDAKMQSCKAAKLLTVHTLQATHILPPDSSSKVFDDGCGIGTVTAEVKKHFPDIHVLAIDSSAGMLKVFERKAKKHHFKNVEIRLLDGGNLSGIYPRNVPRVSKFKFATLFFFFFWCKQALRFDQGLN